MSTCLDCRFVHHNESGDIECSKQNHAEIVDFRTCSHFKPQVTIEQFEKQNTEMLEVITVLLETHTPDQVCKGCKAPPYCPCGAIERAKEIHKIAEKLIAKAEGR